MKITALSTTWTLNKTRLQVRMLFMAIVCIFSCALTLSSYADDDGDAKKYQKDWKDAVQRYERGDYDRAVLEFGLSAAAGLPEGAHAMGVVYDEGKAYPRNLKLAFKYYLCAAEMGYARSQIKVALMYASGSGVDKNINDAYFWLLLASSNKYTEDRSEVVSARDSIGKKVPASSREKAEFKALNWKPKPQTCLFSN